MLNVEKAEYTEHAKKFARFSDILNFASPYTVVSGDHTRKPKFSIDLVDYLANNYLTSREKVYYEMVKLQVKYPDSVGDNRKAKKMLQRELSVLFGVAQPNICVFTKKVTEKLAIVTKFVTNPTTKQEFDLLTKDLEKESPKLALAASILLAGIPVSSVYQPNVFDMRTSVLSVARYIVKNKAKFPSLYTYVNAIRRNRHARSK